MGIKSELHEAILKRGGKVPPYGGIAAAMDELNKLPGGGGDCDWNTMKNRPFGTEYGTIEVLGETTAEVDAEAFSLTEVISLTAGNTYTVKWNGVEYDCVAQEYDLGGFTTVVLGNLGAMVGGSDTGEPFALIAMPELVDGVGTDVAVLDGSTSVTLSIRTEGEIVNQIDPKYIPGGAGGGVSSWNDLTDKPFYTEIVDGRVFGNTRLSFDNDEGTVVLPPLGIVDGATYTVKWHIPGADDVEYKCVAIEDEGAIVLGNIGAMSGGADTGEPFVIIESPSEGYAAVIALDGSSVVYVEINGPVEKVTHISDKYLNGSLTKYVDFETTDSVTGAISTETSSFEIYALVMTGKNVVARLSAPSVGNTGFLQLTTCSVDSCSFCGITSANLERVAVSLITVNEHDATLSQFNLAHTDT